MCIHQQNHFSDKTNTHKTVCEGKNIRRDGKRIFVYLCIFGVFTNKITALVIVQVTKVVIRISLNLTGVIRRIVVSGS